MSAVRKFEQRKKSLDLSKQFGVTNMILDMVYNIPLKPTQQLVLIHMSRFVRDDGKGNMICFPTIETISHRASVSERSVNEALKQLQKLELITVNKIQNKDDNYRNVYKFNIDKFEEIALNEVNYDS